ncbi:MAG: chorismate-binding protein [Deltaproteobacteria bacterium]|nr:MAG: chorismate-binding protein [Deltaproteobacteria bacterium]
MSQESHHTIAAAAPSKIISSTTHTESDLWEALNKTYETDLPNDAPTSPFHGGWIGFFSYEAHTLSSFKNPCKSPQRTPDLTPLWWFGYYDQFDIYDHLNQSPSPIPVFNPTKAETHFACTPNFTKSDYQKAFFKIKHHLEMGDCYQVNLAQRFESDFKGDPYQLYRKLCLTNPAPYAAYLNLGDLQILSSSPECFLASMVQTLSHALSKELAPEAKQKPKMRALSKTCKQTPRITPSS